MISEYIHDSKLLKKVYDGKSEFISFMMFSTYNENGEITLGIINDNNEEVVMTDKDIFASCNTEVDNNMVINISKDLPCYRVVVVRIFTAEHDKFEYKVNIRSNYNMVTYQKSQKEVTEKK